MEYISISIIYITIPRSSVVHSQEKNHMCHYYRASAYAELLARGLWFESHRQQ
jgi:hypothetical protein